MDIRHRYGHQGAVSILRRHLTGIGIPIVKIRRSWFDRRIPYLGMAVFILRRAPHQYAVLCCINPWRIWVNRLLLNHNNAQFLGCTVFACTAIIKLDAIHVIYGLAQDFSNSSALAMELLQFALNHRCDVHLIHYMQNHHPEREWKFSC